MISHPEPVEDVVPRRYPAEFRRKVLELVAAGRPVAQVAYDLQISAQAIYTWRRQQLIGSGRMRGWPAATRRSWWPRGNGSPSWSTSGPSIAGPRNSSAMWCSQKALRGDRSGAGCLYPPRGGLVDRQLADRRAGHQRITRPFATVRPARTW